MKIIFINWLAKCSFILFRTFYFLMFWSLVPGVIMVVSCLYMCVCSKLVFTGDDGHMRIICCGKAITGVYHFASRISCSSGKTIIRAGSLKNRVTNTDKIGQYYL